MSFLDTISDPAFPLVDFSAKPNNAAETWESITRALIRSGNDRYNNEIMSARIEAAYAEYYAREGTP